MRSSTLYSTGIGSGIDVAAVDEHGRRAEHAVRLRVRVGLDLDDLDLRRDARLVDDALDDDEGHSAMRAILAREDLDPNRSVRLRSRHVGPPPQGERRFPFP